LHGSASSLGCVLTGFGLGQAAPPAQGGDVAAHDVIFLVAGGLLTCLIGITGLMGFMGWIPGLRKEEEISRLMYAIERMHSGARYWIHGKHRRKPLRTPSCSTQSLSY
jgi:hypothetical protein